MQLAKESWAYVRLGSLLCLMVQLEACRTAFLIAEVELVLSKRFLTADVLSGVPNIEIVVILIDILVLSKGMTYQPQLTVKKLGLA